MNVDEAVSRACEEPTLVDALIWIVGWESERVVAQAMKGERGPDGQLWDSCYGYCIRLVTEKYKGKVMNERYVSAYPLPTPRERELLDILQEECLEAAIRVSKALRFGLDETQPLDKHPPPDELGLTNRERLGLEIGDVTEMIETVSRAGIVDPDDVSKGERRKRAKLKEFLQSEEDDAKETET